MPQSEARGILDSRLAAGEITEEEYNRVLSRFDTGDPTTLSPSRAAPSARTEPPASSPWLVSAGRLPNPPATDQRSSRPPGKSFILLRLWRGEVSLPVTYWVWGVLAGALVGFTLGGQMGAVTTRAEATALAIVLAAWSIFIAVSIFRSGGAYSRRFPGKGWGRVAQVLACLGLLASLGNIVRAFPGNESDYDLDNLVLEVNRPGPHMVGERVRFDKVTRQGRTFLYSLTVLGQSHVAAAEDLAKGRADAIKTACRDQDIRRFLLTADKLTFRYVSESGAELMNYDILPSDCP